jgi:hypothetical protein
MSNPIRLVRVLTAAAAVGGLTLATAPALAATSPDAIAPRIVSTYCGHHIYSLTTIPAARFSPLTASRAQLSANNFPARPSAGRPALLAQWKRFVAWPGATRSTCAGLHVTHRKSGGLPRTGAARPAGKTGSATQNWSGVVVHNNYYSDAEANWTLPTAHGSSGTNDYSSSWVGIGLGQSSSYPLMQAGTESDYTSGSGHYYFWLEVFPEEDQVVKDGAVLPGDAVGTHITYTTSGPEFHLWDTTSGLNAEYKVSGSWKNDGHAEWIYERTEINGELPYLADAPPTFTSAQAVVSGTWYPMGKLPYYSQVMYNCPETQELAYPGTISSNGYSFGEEFLHYGDECAPGS